MLERIPDALDQWDKYDAEQCRLMDQLPECADCGHPIQDETAFYINGEFICENCMESYRVNVEDYIKE